MKKQVVNCETGVTEIIDVPDDEKAVLLERSAEAAAEVEAQQALPKPKTLEERIAELEAALAAK